MTTSETCQVTTEDNRTEVADYLEMMLGPVQMDDHLTLVIITLFYTTVLVTGILGNISVCLVIFRSSHLHTAMNYYLVSLAFADLMIIILGVPHELSIYWNQYPYTFGEAFCKIRSFLSESASYASVLTILSFSLERYLAICTPLYIFPLSDIKRAAIVSVLCWTIALAASVPHLVFTKINYIDLPYQSGNFICESAFCAMLDENVYPASYPVHELSFVIFFVIPILLLMWFYSNMIIVIRQAHRSQIRRSTFRRTDNQSVGSVNDSRKQIVYMLISVIVLFFVSWAPFHVQRLGYVYFKHFEMFRTVNQILFYFSGCFYYLSSTLNPLLYNVMSVKYRQAFRATISCAVNPDEGPPVLKFTTVFNTSTTNLLTSSYIHLKDLLDSRRNSRASVTLRPDPGLLTPQHAPGPREVRSSSLGNSSHTLLLPQLGHQRMQQAQISRRTNLSRQTSVSDSGGKMICPRRTSAVFSPPDVASLRSLHSPVTPSTPRSQSPGPAITTLVEEKEESSTSV